ncbi:hypothetical protein L6164_026297 [Bauhinia variegata]|uniref:Uncharacterized protein n=1 Tax=Bauhinia variegata TaxID=167791 RepID=A0ACB9LPP2_BAUVA|nr:hypothetical protein L6164_026297 [Bauhinia variegata]
MKARVKMNVKKPLKHGMQVGNKEDGSMWVAFRYERPPQFCYFCGSLGHDEKMCDVLGEEEMKGCVKDMLLSPWRAETSWRRVTNEGMGPADGAAGGHGDLRSNGSTHIMAWQGRNEEQIHVWMDYHRSSYSMLFATLASDEDLAPLPLEGRHLVWRPST